MISQEVKGAKYIQELVTKLDKFIAAILPLGVPDENPQARNRKPLEEVMKIIE